MNYSASQSTKIPPVSKKALPWLGISLAGTALLGGFSLFSENRALTASLSSFLEEKNSDVVNTKKDKNSRSHSWNVPLAIPYFVGRQELSEVIVTHLEQAMQDSNSNHPSIVLSGMGGIGKTQLAVHCIKRAQASSSINCFWFEAETPDRLDAAYRSFYMEIARPEETLKNVQVTMQVGDVKAGGSVSISGMHQPELTPDNIRSIVKAWFAKHPDCVLVYDNVKDYESIQKFLPISSGQVMILTRRAEWPANFRVHNLRLLERAESVTLLTELGQVKGEDKSVAELARKLGDLPLALTQAGAYMRYKRKSAESYLDLYNKYRAKMLADGTMPAGIAHSPVMATWEMSLEEIDKQDAFGTTRTLFTLCAYGAPEGVLRNLLQCYLERKGVPEAELKVDEAITQLRNYSLLEVSEDGKKLIVHRLVQEVTRIHHEAERIPQRENLISWYSPWLSITAEQFTLLNNDKERTDYLSQALAVIKHQERLFSEKANSENLVLAHLRVRAGSSLFYQGFYHKAKEQFERALKIQEAHYGKDHVEVAGILNNLGSAYGLLGDHVTECDYLKRALKIKESYGKDHVEMAEILNNLGNAYGSLGDHITKRDYLERALKIEETHYGKDHVEVAVTLNNLGNAYGSLGDHVTERDYLERALKIKESSYGKDHVEVAGILNNLGNAYGSLGDHVTERDYLERALKIKESYYGKDHVEVAGVLNNLGSAYGSLGNHSKKRDYLERALKIEETHYGKDHVEVAVTLNNLGNAYGSLGDHVTERDYLERALKIFMNSPGYGREHPYTQILMRQLSPMPSVTQTPQTLFTPNKQSPNNVKPFRDNEAKLNMKPNG